MNGRDCRHCKHSTKSADGRQYLYCLQHGMHVKGYDYCDKYDGILTLDEYITAGNKRRKFNADSDV
jgi:hypothetical protein